MSSRRPADARLELIDARNYEPQLRPSDFLGVPPSQEAQADRAAAQRTWRALQATPEDIVQERAELEKMDRAVVAMRKQVHAARAESRGLREQLARAEKERYPAAAVWSVGLLAVLAGSAWIFERRKALDRKPSSFAASLLTVPPPPAPTGPNTEARGESTFASTDPNAAAEEAEEWIERLRVGAPRP
jgi:small-conductance mechanosensitive channel